MKSLYKALLLPSLLLGMVPTEGLGQLVDQTAISPPIAGGGVGKSLEQQVGAGQGDEYEYGSSVYLIKRDPARAIRRGRQLFQRKFTADQGLGPRVNFAAMGDIRETPALGAGLSDSCAACHSRPRGSAGFGGAVATHPDGRDAPHLFGLGLIEMLADEVTNDLREIRTKALEEARERARHRSTKRCPKSLGPWWWRICSAYYKRDGRVHARLVSKGIDFGSISVDADGVVDVSDVRGVDADLRVRPFFATGEVVSIREFIVLAFGDEMGLQSADPILCAATDPYTAEPVVSPAGMVFDPRLDEFLPPRTCDVAHDADFDGVANEIDPAVVDHLEFYLLNYFKPARGEITGQVEWGERLMAAFRCNSCHIQDLYVESDRRVADVETVFDAERGIFNRLFATAETRFEFIDDGEEYPLAKPLGEGFLVRDIWTDLKRHDLGPAFHERSYSGELQTTFMTEPLWGVGSTAPYGHDGRSINLEEVILRHGGEARRSRDRFANAPREDRRALIAFLNSLVLFPPDDTASNLNPGVPGTKNPQSPSEHGSVALSRLFQIPSDTPE